jgi:hypothetical protein
MFLFDTCGLRSWEFRRVAVACADHMHYCACQGGPRVRRRLLLQTYAARDSRQRAHIHKSISVLAAQFTMARLALHLRLSAILLFS